MQNCFRQYPEVYGSELDSDADDEDETAADLAASESTPATSASGSPSLSASDVSSDAQTTPSRSRQNETDHAAAAKGKVSSGPSSKPHSAEQVEANRRELGLVPDNYKPDQKTSAVEGSSDTERANQAAQQTKSREPVSESESLVPKAAFDASDDNTKVLERK
jgi:intermembrane space import and assembly protein 40